MWAQKCEDRKSWMKKKLKKRSSLFYVTLPTLHMQPFNTCFPEFSLQCLYLHPRAPSYLWCEREVIQLQTSYICPPASPITIKTAKSTLNQIMLSNCFHISLWDNGCLLLAPDIPDMEYTVKRDNVTNRHGVVRVSATAGLGCIPISNWEGKKRLQLWSLQINILCACSR